MAQKEQITAKQYGRNIVMNIDGQKHSRAFEDPADREIMLKKVEAFNKRNSKAKKAAIITLMTEHLTEKQKEKRFKVSKQKLRKPKSASKKVSTTEKEKADKIKATDELKRTYKSSRRKSGEY